MSTKYKIQNQEAIYFITLTIIDWVDLFTRPIYKHIFLEGLEYCQKNKGLIIHAFVIMSNHVHLIVCNKSNYLIEDTIRDLKKHSSKKFVNAITELPESRKEWLLNKFSYAANRIKRGQNYKVWKDGFHPIELASPQMIQQRLKYIHNNPIKEEIVNSPEDYKYSSAENYTGRKGVLEIDLI